MGGSLPALAAARAIVMNNSDGPGLVAGPEKSAVDAGQAAAAGVGASARWSLPGVAVE